MNSGPSIPHAELGKGRYDIAFRPGGRCVPLRAAADAAAGRGWLRRLLDCAFRRKGEDATEVSANTPVTSRA